MKYRSLGHGLGIAFLGLSGIGCSEGSCAGSSDVAGSSDPVTDDFERSSLGSNWNITKGAPAIVDNSDLGLLPQRGRI